jgi:hypothetical protein
MAKKKSKEKESLWREIMERQMASGVSVRSFCAAEGISEPSFYFWRRKLRPRERERVRTPRKSTRPEQASGSAPMFIPFNLLETTAGLEIVHPLGYRIQVTGDVNPVALRHVLEALDQRGAR